MQIRTLSLTMILLLPVGLSVGQPAEDTVLAEIDDLEPGDVAVLGFELDRAQEVRLEALGLEVRKGDHKTYELAAAWILNARSREVVWSLREARPVSRRRDLSEYDEKLRLDAGAYEVYYATYPSYHSKGDHDWWEHAARSMARMFGWDDEADLEAAVGDLELVIRGEGRALDVEDLEGTRSSLREEALVAVAAGDDRLAENRGFVLDKPMELLIYAVGELGQEEGGYDHGWIIDAKTREKVWRLTWDDSQPAGGAKKNRAAYDTVSLPAGEYAAYFVTDGSHSPEHWNALPPHDPSFWGLTVWLKDPGQQQFARASEYRHLPGEELLIAELTRLREDDHRTHGFTLSQPTDVRVYAVGEGTKHGMADYGWIMNARTRQKVWAMDYERTEPAGGAGKNRLADEVIHLEAGSYIVAFVTDDSHSYRDWNSAPPNYPERWGISLFGGEGFDRGVVSDYREEEDPGVLARIARVKSDSHRRRDFTLEAPAQVSVYALGEGTHGEMYDYAWIEDAESRVVWEMTYPMTDGAGGAPKNRLYQGTLELPAGEYVLHYQSDDSHAYREWNASPPHDPDAWGVQIALVE